jgi:hypothetical protein
MGYQGQENLLPPQPPHRSSAQVPIPRPLSSLLTPCRRLRLCGGGGQDLVRHDMLDNGSSPAASQLSMARSCHSSASCATPLPRVGPKPSPSSPAATREHVTDGVAAVARSRRKSAARRRIMDTGDRRRVIRPKRTTDTFAVVSPLICVFWIQLTRTNAVFSRFALVSCFCAEI